MARLSRRGERCKESKRWWTVIPGPATCSATRGVDSSGRESARLVVLRGRLAGRSPRFSSRAAIPLRAILEIAFAHIHSRFRTYNDLRSRFRSWRPERQQSLHCRPTALRCRPISLASRRRTAAPPRVSRQSCHATRRVDHHVPCAPDAGGQSSRSPGATE